MSMMPNIIEAKATAKSSNGRTVNVEKMKKKVSKFKEFLNKTWENLKNKKRPKKAYTYTILKPSPSSLNIFE